MVVKTRNKYVGTLTFNKLRKKNQISKKQLFKKNEKVTYCFEPIAIQCRI